MFKTEAWAAWEKKEKEKDANLLLTFVLLRPVVVLIIHCYCLWPSTRAVQCEFRRIPAFMWGGCDCEEVFPVGWNDLSFLCFLWTILCSWMLQDHLLNCLSKRVFCIWETGSYVPLKAPGDSLAGGGNAGRKKALSVLQRTGKGGRAWRWGTGQRHAVQRSCPVQSTSSMFGLCNVATRQ